MTRTGMKAFTEAVIGTAKGGNCLALGRNLAAYVIAPHLLKLPKEKDKRFRKWLRQRS